MLALAAPPRLPSRSMEATGSSAALALAARQVATPHVVAEERNVTLEVFRALADPVRLELLAYVAAHGPICVCHLEQRLGLSQSRVSKHLGTLRRAGLVSSRRDGSWVYYELDERAVGLARGFLTDVADSARTPHEADFCAEPDGSA